MNEDGANARKRPDGRCGVGADGCADDGARPRLRQTTLDFVDPTVVRRLPFVVFPRVVPRSAAEQSVPSYQPQSLYKTLEADPEAISSWIVPTNVAFRPYQISLAAAGLGGNTLMCLPTGLGKTRIAALVTLNMLHWFPTAKALFIAPTKPLLAQQRIALLETTGLAEDRVTELSGVITAEARERIWHDHDRSTMVLATAQVVLNDVVGGRMDASRLALLVIDEAHRARGNSAVCLLTKELFRRTNGAIRIVALSATPGKSKQDVQQLVDNLSISRLCFKHESDPDIAPFVHTRSVSSFVVRLTGALRLLLLDVALLAEQALRRLVMANAFYVNVRVLFDAVREEQRIIRAQAPGMSNQNWDPDSDTDANDFVLDSLPGVVALVNARERWRKEFTSAQAVTTMPHAGSITFAGRSGPRGPTALRGSVEGDFAFCLWWVSALKSLRLHGIRPLAGSLSRMALPPHSTRARQECVNSHLFQGIRARVDDFLRQGVVHPKIERCEELIREHLRQHATQTDAPSRVIVFAELRETVSELEERLAKYSEVRARGFVGQSNPGAPKSSRSPSRPKRGRVKAESTSVGGALGAAFPKEHNAYIPRQGMAQTEQSRVVDAFKRGDLNVLIATCIGEEGLDIGSVDLIIMLDVTASPVRWIQRMGRTARFAAGNVIALVSHGNEQRRFEGILDSNTSVPSFLRDPDQHLSLYAPSSYLLPAPREKVPGVWREIYLRKQATVKLSKKRTRREAAGDVERTATRATAQRISGKLGSRVDVPAQKCNMQSHAQTSREEDVQWWSRNRIEINGMMHKVLHDFAGVEADHSDIERHLSRTSRFGALRGVLRFGERIQLDTSYFHRLVSKWDALSRRDFAQAHPLNNTLQEHLEHAAEKSDSDQNGHSDRSLYCAWKPLLDIPISPGSSPSAHLLSMD